ncbi:MAG: hypothetical protein RL375_4393 [Pseudomonadota bacterium]
MTMFLRQSTASQEILLGPFVDATDGNTAETALTIANTDIKIWKAGATTLANKNSGGATHISSGNYSAVLDATDTDTLGSGAIVVQVAGALAVRLPFTVLPANVFDSLIAGSDLLDTSVVQWTGTAVATPDTAGHPKVTIKTGTGAGELSLTSGRVLARSGIQKNTALANFTFTMTDSTNHNPAPSLTVTGTRSLDGGAFASGTIANMTEIGNGVYQCDLGAGDLNGDVVQLRFTASGADDLTITIVPNP